MDDSESAMITEPEPYEDSSTDYIPESYSDSTDSEVTIPNECVPETRLEKRKGKKRIRRPDKWKRNVRKAKRAKGEEYVNSRGNTVPKRQTGSPCNCRMKCFEKVNDNIKRDVLNAFQHEGDKNRQDAYLGGLITVSNIKRRRPKTGGGIPRSHAFSYQIRSRGLQLRVCKAAFASIHGVTKSRIERIAQHLTTNILSPKDMRGQHNNRPNKIKPDIKKNIEDHINSFPRRKSHYSRKDNANRRYLASELSVKLMHKLYLQKFEPEQYSLLNKPEFKPKVSYTYYRRVFVENFNLSFGHPRTDTCKVCDQYDNKIKFHGADEKKKKQIETEKILHLTKADTFYKDLKEKTALSKQDKSVEVISFDFQQNMPLPHVPSSDVFYKRQLWFYPFCIHKGSISKSFFYVFDEVTGKKSPNEVISCLHDFIESHIPEEVKTLYVFSDNCAAQNKNMVLVQFWQTLILQGRFKAIRHRYPEPGHSFLPCDRSFAIVEKEKRKRERVYLPEEWSRMIKNSSRKFEVKEVKQEMILNYKDKLAPFFKKGNITAPGGLKFQISRYRVILFSDEHKDGSISCSEYASGVLTNNINILKRSAVPPLPGPEDKLYCAPLPLKYDKLQNVLDLARQYVGQTEMWYYNNLKPVEKANSDNESSATEDEDD